MASVYNRGSKDRPVWWARVKVGGRWLSRPTGASTKGAALTKAEELQARADRGEPIDDPADASARAPRTPAARLTVNDLLDRFLCEYRRGRILDMDRYRATARQVLARRVRPHLGGMIAAELRPAHVAAWIATLERTYSGAAINQAMAFLSAAYSWAGRMEVLTCRNPVAGTERFVVKPLEDCLTLPQVRALLAYAEGQGPELHALIAAALYVGARRGELMGALWSHVKLDGELPSIEIRHSYKGPTKTGKTRIAPIHPEMLVPLRRWRDACPTPDGPVFPVHVTRGRRTGRGAAAEPWRAGTRWDTWDIRDVLEAAGCPHKMPRPFHCMRHTMITLAVEAGVARDAVEMVVGHRTSGSRTTAGYLHVGLPYLTREMSKLRLLPPAPADVVDLGEKRRERAAGT